MPESLIDRQQREQAELSDLIWRTCDNGPNRRDSDLIAAAILSKFDLRPNPHAGYIGHHWQMTSSGPEGSIWWCTRDDCKAIEWREGVHWAPSV
jgi:hypothetical protein